MNCSPDQLNVSWVVSKGIMKEHSQLILAPISLLGEIRDICFAGASAKQSISAGLTSAGGPCVTCVPPPKFSALVARFRNTM